MATVSQAITSASTDRDWKSFALRLALSIALLFSALSAARRGIAYLYFLQMTPESLAKATAWAPDNPEYYAVRARRMQELSVDTPPESVVALYEEAARLAPQDAQKWADLGSAYEWAGNEGKAHEAFSRAASLFPHSPKLNWKVGNFYIRSGRYDEALQALKKVVTGDPKLRMLTFDLAWRADPNEEAILETLVPEDTETQFDYLEYLAHSRRYPEAERVWDRIVGKRESFDLRPALRYINRILRDQQGSQALRAWNDLYTFHPLFNKRRLPDPSNLIENGDMEDPMLGAGFDWLFQRQRSAMLRIDRFTFYSATHSLRIEFGGRDNVSFNHVYKYIPVEPATEYVFTGYMKTNKITTDSGPYFLLEDAEDPRRLRLQTESLTGTNGWSPQTLSFTTGPETKMLRLRIARRPSLRIDNQISGRVWIDRVSLRKSEHPLPF